MEILLSHLYELVERDYVANDKKSIRNIRGSWKAHLAHAFGKHPARDFDPELVQAYIRERQGAGTANSTINRELSIVKHGAALALELLKTNDAKLIGALTRWARLKNLKERNARKGFLKNQEYAALARETAAIGPWLAALFECAYRYGFRKSELLEMRVHQIDLEERTIRLDPGETKNDDPREVRMVGRVYELVREMITGKAAEEFVFTRPARCGWIFRIPGSCFWWMQYHDAAGQKVRESTRTDDEAEARAILLAKDVPGPERPVKEFRAEWKQATRQAGVPKLYFHDLRRTGIRNMLRNGIAEKVAMKISGHKTRSAFDRYDITDGADLKEASEKMERAAVAAGVRIDLSKQPFTVVTLDSPQPCAEPDCRDRAVVAIETRGSPARTYCRSHSHVQFALWNR